MTDDLDDGLAAAADATPATCRRCSRSSTGWRSCSNGRELTELEVEAGGTGLVLRKPVALGAVGRRAPAAAATPATGGRARRAASRPRPAGTRARRRGRRSRRR